MWLGNLVARALDSRIDSLEFSSWLPQSILGWVTVFGRANHLGVSPSHPGQLSFLPSLDHEMSTSQSMVMLYGWEVKAVMVHSACGYLWVGGK